MIDLITGHQGIPHISAEQISTLHRSLMGTNGDNKVVRMKDGGVTSVGLTVAIDTGYWRVHGYDMQIQEAEAVIFDPTEAGYQRIDDLFVEILQDISSGVQRSELVIVQGEPSATTPIAPAAPTEAASEYDLLVKCVPVCSVLVIEGAMTMTDLTIPFKVSSGGSESLAPEFDPERPEPYEIGEIVENEGKLYIFIRQHSGPWDDADVEETTVAALLAEVNNELSAIENVYGAKNLIPYPCNQFSRTNNGITFTDNGDGTVTANGTATADASYNISQRYGVSGGSFSLKNGNYLLSGCESGSNTTFFLQTGVTKNGVFSLLNKNYDGDTAITVDGDDNSNDSANIAVQIVIRSGQTLTNKTFKPMIRLASIQDDTYVPYVPTNKELMSCKLNGYVGAKNLLPYPYYHTTKTENGLTITDNGDGTIAIIGTATRETTFYLNHENIGAILGKGSYTLSGCPTDGNRESGYFLEISGRATSADSWTVFTTDIGEGATFTITEAMLNWDAIHVFIRVRSGKAISSAITFKPMIRRVEDTDSTWQPYAKTNKELTDDVNEIEEDLENTMDLIRGDNDEYSSLKSYKVGQYVVVKPPLVAEETIYKCISPCSPGSWVINQSHFEAKTLTEAVTDLNNDLTYCIKEIGTFTESTVGANNTTVTHNITFTKSYTSAPIVLAQVNARSSDNPNNTGKLFVSVNNVTTTGCTINITNVYASAARNVRINFIVIA